MSNREKVIFLLGMVSKVKVAVLSLICVAVLIGLGSSSYFDSDGELKTSTEISLRDNPKPGQTLKDIGLKLRDNPKIDMQNNVGLPPGISLRDNPKPGQTLKDIGLRLMKEEFK